MDYLPWPLVGIGWHRIFSIKERDFRSNSLSSISHRHPGRNGLSVISNFQNQHGLVDCVSAFADTNLYLWRDVPFPGRKSMLKQIVEYVANARPHEIRRCEDSMKKVCRGIPFLGQLN